MWILIVSIVAFITICFIANLIDENKDKLIEKFKIEKKEIMKCPICYKEYEDLKLKECSHCKSYLEKRIKYKFPKELKKKILYIIIGSVLLALIVISVYVGISNFIQKKQKIEKYENDIMACYETIKNDSDWSNFRDIINTHNEESNFEPEAYEKLYNAIDERIEHIKNGNEDNELITMLESIKKDKNFNSVSKPILEKIESKYLIANSYSNINKANKQIEEQKFKETYELLETVITSNKDKNQDIVDIATNRQNEIKEKAFEQVIAQAQKKINSKEYSSAQTLLGKYKDLGNQTIVDMYNNATIEVNRIEAERKAKEELERRKQQEEERKRQQAELDAKKDKIIVDTNGKRIYKVCMASNRFSISGNFKGQGHFSIKLLDDNQEFYDLLVNEIGDYVVDTSTRVTKGDYYYVQIECSRGSWNLSWSGTYGE